VGFEGCYVFASELVTGCRLVVDKNTSRLTISTGKISKNSGMRAITVVKK
jgi:hypothetical protein